MLQRHFPPAPGCRTRKFLCLSIPSTLPRAANWHLTRSTPTCTLLSHVVFQTQARCASSLGRRILELHVLLLYSSLQAPISFATRACALVLHVFLRDEMRAPGCFGAIRQKNSSVDGSQVALFVRRTPRHEQR
ncbi:hypothetical protein B0H15DRAFT_957863 [Mycena belliarum]|uniref:Uncharacterized protein n=1 Tax=Mycena belliarum TaxID=1033014 RepID=A0AAD6TLK1_9AGAR|nr:hypothetical protein B0H15DRAFT_957863 [Mycena belliae]